MGCGDFTGPLSIDMAMRANSTAMSAASASDTRLGPLPCNRASHSFMRVSGILKDSARSSPMCDESCAGGFTARLREPKLQQSYGLPARPLKHLFLLVKVE